MKKTLIVLAAAIAVLVLILFKNKHDEKTSSADVFAFDSTQKATVKSFKVCKNADTSELQLKDGKWVVTPNDFPADTAKVNKVLKVLFALQNKEIVSQNPERLKEYGLDASEAKNISVQSVDGKKLVDAWIGKTSGADYNSTYWKMPNQKEVFRTPGNFTWEILAKADEWKDRKLFSATLSKEVKSLEVTWRDSTDSVFTYHVVNENDSNWKMTAPVETKVVKQAVTELINRFAEFSVDEFIATNDTNLSKVDLQNPRIQIQVGLKNGNTIVLKAGKTFNFYTYAQHPSRSDLIKFSSWRFEGFKKRPYELQVLSHEDSLALKLDKKLMPVPMPKAMKR